MEKLQRTTHFNSLKIKSQRYKNRILRKFARVIDNGIFLNGQQTKKLTEKLLSFLDKKGYLTLVASGHDALYLALSALKLTKDDEVIFPVNSYPTAFPICLSLAKPVPCDVNANGQLDPKELIKKVNKKTKAIILVHLYGLVGDIEKIKDIADKNNIVLIEDSAQAFGSKYKNQFAGTLGDIGCFSFYPTKNLGTLGDGGAIWTKDKKIFSYLKKAISYGEQKRYFSEFISGHSRMPELQAAVLNIYLLTINQEIEKRREVFCYFEKKLARLNRWIRVLKSDEKSLPAPHLFVIEAKKRNQLMKFLKNKGIETHIHYSNPIHLLPAFSYLKYKRGDFPMAERLSNHILSLPFHSFLKKREIDDIVKKIRNFYCN